MKLAFVGPDPASDSRVAVYAEKLLARLREIDDLEVFATRVPDPREFDHVVYQVGNEPECAFIPPLVRAIGGLVVLHDWNLGELARAAWPELRGEGLRRAVRSWREGPALNRSVVRFADAFLVHDADLAERIRVDRNAPTPVAVLRDPGETPEDWARLAREYGAHFEMCPAPRAKKKSLLRAMVEASDRRRADG